MTQISYCMSCERQLPAQAFRKNEKLSDGLDSWCNECRSEYNRQWKIDNADHVAEQAAAYNESRRAARAAERLPRACSECGKEFLPKRKDALTCSVRCRARRSRRI